MDCSFPEGVMFIKCHKIVRIVRVQKANVYVPYQMVPELARLLLSRL